MFNRRQFLKSLLVGTGLITLPSITKATTPPQISQLTEREYHAIKLAYMEWSGCDRVRWGIPGDKRNLGGVLLLDNYVVDHKWHHNGKTVYIELSKKWAEPDEALTKHIDDVWQVYMNKRAGKVS